MKNHKKNKIILLLFSILTLLFSLQVQADITPRGTKPIPVVYKILPPKDNTSHVYLWQITQRYLAHSFFNLEPVIWDASKPKTYSQKGTLLILLSFNKKQALHFVQFLLEQEEFKKQKKAVAKMKPKEQFKWLSQIKITIKYPIKKIKKTPKDKKPTKTIMPHPIEDYIAQKSHAARLILRPSTLVAEHSPATQQLRVVQIVKTEKNKIIWKAKDKVDHDKEHHAVPTIVGKGAYLVTRWKMILLGFILALATALFLRQRKII